MSSAPLTLSIFRVVSVEPESIEETAGASEPRVGSPMRESVVLIEPWVSGFVDVEPSEPEEREPSSAEATPCAPEKAIAAAATTAADLASFELIGFPLWFCGRSIVS